MSRFRLFSLLAIAVLFERGYCETWNITGSGSWGVAGNWIPTSIPNSATTDVIFSSAITSNATVTIPGTFAIRNLSITAPGFEYLLSGGILNASPTTGITVTGTDAHSITSDLNFLTACTISQGSSGALTLSGALAGSSTLAKTGMGELILSGASANTMSGVFTISAGQVTLNKTAGVEAYAGNITLSAAGATLQLGASEQTSSTAAYTISNATAVFDLNNQSTTIGSLTITTTGTYALGMGTLSLAGTTTTTLSSSVTGTSPTITGQINLISASGGVNKTGTGTLSLQNVGIYNGTHAFTSTAPGTIDISGVVDGNGGLDKSGTGSLDFTGTATNSYTGGTTVSGGTMNLSRSAGLSIPGDITIAGGTVVLNNGAYMNQIANTANMTLTTGTFNMNAKSEEFSSLTMNGGTLSNNTGSGLTLNSTGTALTMSNVTITGQILLTGASGGGIVFDPTNNGTATLSNVNLGSVTRTFNIGEGSAVPDMTVNGAISGTGGLTKTGTGTLSFTSTTSNSYSGLTTVSAGTLLLSKTSPFLSIAGNLLINGGTVRKTVVNQISTTSDVQLNSGTFNLNGFAETINSFTFYGGTFSQGGATLSLASTATALTMRNTTINGTVNLTGASGGSVVFDSTNGGSALINSINLGTVDRTFTIAAGSNSSTKMTLQGGTGTGAAIIKEGAGILELTGTHTYTLATTQVNNGTLLVNGTLTCPTMTVGASGKVGGTGTIQANTTFNGLLQPGSSIGTLNLVGATTFGSSSVLEVEFDQSSADLVNITGALTINAGASVTLAPLASSFTTPLSYTIVQTTGGVTGMFSTITNPLLTYSASLSYTGNNVVLTLSNAPFSNLNLTGNALIVANYLDQLTIPAGSDLAAVDSAIRQLSTSAEVQSALLQLQPSQFKGFALAQENNLFQIESYIFQRTNRNCYPCSENVSGLSLWSAVGGAFYHQNPFSQEIAFDTKNINALIGIDNYLNQTVLFGFAGGYSASSTTWAQSAGSGDMQSGNLVTYLSLNRKRFYISGLVLGSFNSFTETRHIDFSSINRKAHGSFNGGEVVGNLEIGGILGETQALKVVPFVSGQYMYMHLSSFTESGADSLNLQVLSSNYTLFRGEIGLNFFHCTMTDLYKLSPSFGASYIREQRFHGSTFTAALIGYNSYFTVYGMNPSRNIFSPRASLSISPFSNAGCFTFNYEAEIGQRYFSQDFVLEGRYTF